jgi:hypothetical protein
MRKIKTLSLLNAEKTSDTSFLLTLQINKTEQDFTVSFADNRTYFCKQKI